MNGVKDLLKTIAFKAHALPFKAVSIAMRVAKINNKRIFVQSFNKVGLSDNPKYIVLELLKQDPSYKVIWVSEKETSEDERIKFVKPESLKAIFYRTTSKIIISSIRSPYHMLKRKGQVYIQSWHGTTGFKKSEAENLEALTQRYILLAKHDSALIDYLIAPSKETYDYFKEYFWYNGDSILKIGAPRNDILYQKDYVIPEYLRDFSDKKICLYAPTFRRGRSLESYMMDYEKLKAVLTKRFGGEWVIFVRFHPTMADRVEDFIKQLNCDFVYNGSAIDDGQEVLKMADVLITDYSSIILDYAITLKPGFFYAPDIESYAKERDFHMSPKDTPFPFAESEKELIQNIELFDEEKFGEEIQSFNKRLGVYGTGEASRITAELIRNITK